MPDYEKVVLFMRVSLCGAVLVSVASTHDPPRWHQPKLSICAKQAPTSLQAHCLLLRSYHAISHALVGPLASHSMNLSVPLLLGLLGTSSVVSIGSSRSKDVATSNNALEHGEPYPIISFV